jgi:hypothetical protein
MFLTAPRVMAGPKVWLNSTNSNFQVFEKWEIWIYWFLRRKSWLSFWEIVCNTMLLIFEDKQFQFLSCPRTIYLCKHMSDFRCLAGAVGTTNFSFYWRRCFDSINVPEVTYCSVAIDSHRFPVSWEHHELWSFQMCDWLERIRSFNILRK